MSMAAAYSMKKRKGMGHGGMKSAHKVDDMMDDDIVDRVMEKRQKLSEGGIVANKTEVEADFDPAEFDDLVLRDDLELDNSGATSGDELGNAQEDEDRRDIVAKVMRKRMKQTNPRPA